MSARQSHGKLPEIVINTRSGAAIDGSSLLGSRMRISDASANKFKQSHATKKPSIEAREDLLQKL